MTFLDASPFLGHKRLRERRRRRRERETSPVELDDEPAKNPEEKPITDANQ